MVIVLEGTNGVGKTTYAKALSEELECPILRPFRRSTNHHLEARHNPVKSTPHRSFLDRMKVPVNTHVDDLYVADFLCSTRAKAVLDRSVPSAISYGKIHNHFDGWYHEERNVHELFFYWQQRMVEVGAVYIWLRAPREVASSRGSGWNPNRSEFFHLDETFTICYVALGESIPKIQINTAEVPINTGVAQICRLLKN